MYQKLIDRYKTTHGRSIKVTRSIKYCLSKMHLTIFHGELINQHARN